MNCYLFKRFSFSLLSALLLFGCADKEVKPISKKEQKAIHVKQLKKEVKKLDTHDKRLIYRSIKNDIKLHKQMGDYADKNGYYYDALKNYELVNFYEGYSAIPSQKLKTLRENSHREAIKHYKTAQKYLQTKQSKKALQELNRVMMNDPNYKNTRELYTTLYNRRDMKIYLNNLSGSIDEAIQNYQHSYKELISIKNKKRQLLSYDYKSKTAQRADKLLATEKKRLLSIAKQSYKKRQFKQAAIEFRKLLSLYPHDTVINHYLNEIAFKESKKHNLELAKQNLKNNNYLLSINYAKKVLQLQNSNKEAQKIIQDAKKQAAKALEGYLKEGKSAYNQKNLNISKKYFEAALKLDKTNNTALIYYKKIQRQLQTLQSLQ
jgi:tetratricopeptide (TPR) repeat protein